MLDAKDNYLSRKKEAVFEAYTTTNCYLILSIHKIENFQDELNQFK